MEKSLPARRWHVPTTDHPVRSLTRRMMALNGLCAINGKVLRMMQADDAAADAIAAGDGPSRKGSSADDDGRDAVLPMGDRGCAGVCPELPVCL